MRFALTPWAGVIVFAIWASALSAQPPASFDVASVKPAAPVSGRAFSGVQGGPGSRDPGRIAYRNVTLKTVLGIAYNVQIGQIAGPAWLDSQRYDITAKVPDGATLEQFRVMLQNLVTERFQLAFHRETKDFPEYHLLTAKNGPKLKPAEAGAPAPVPAARDRGSHGGPGDANEFPIPPLHQTAQRGGSDGSRHMAGNQITMVQFANFLRLPVTFEESGGAMVAPMDMIRVVDETGMSGEYYVRLEYHQTPVGGPAAPEAASDPSGLPNLFAALPQQLGLRLEKTKSPLEVLVIDRVERTPSEN